MPQSCWKCGAPPAASLAILDLPPAPAASEYSPDLTRLLTSNDVPLDSALLHIHRIITNELDRIDVLDPQIDNLRAVLAHLVQRRDVAAESARQHRAIISPVRRIPPELICEIFALTLSTTGPRPKDPPGILATCRSWRKSALSYPILW
ncbi:hypothetical protein C8R44DRAFT_686459, partial [Mycena epipterygia]